MTNFKLKQVVLLLGDIFLLYASLAIALLIRKQGSLSFSDWQIHVVLFSAVYLVWLVSFYSVGFYDLSKFKLGRAFSATLLNTLIIDGLLAAFFFYLAEGRLTVLSPQTILFLNIIFFGGSFYFWRLFFLRFIAQEALSQPIAFVGAIPQNTEAFSTLYERPYLGYRVALIGSYDAGTMLPEQTDLVRITHPELLIQTMLRHNIKTVVMHFPDERHAAFREQLYHALSAKLSFIDLTAFSETITGKVYVTVIGQSWFLHNLTEGSKQFYGMGKRFFDIVVSIVLAIVTLPFIPFIYAAIKLTSQGSAFFTQWRIGKDGKKFLAMKFRTMYNDAEKHGAQWAKKNDPRVTRVGRFLRKTRIDEIPQLINVLRGEMSFVGPRPERVEFVEELTHDIPFYQERHLVKPGLTGWAQINFPYGASKEDALEKLQYDLYYIKNRSFMLDSIILLKTIKTVLQGSGQ